MEKSTTDFNLNTSGLIQSLVITSDPQYPWTDCTDDSGRPFQNCSIRNVSPCILPGSSENRATRRIRSQALIREQYENINSYTEHSDRVNRPSAVIINGDITEFGHNESYHPERQWDTMNDLFRVLRRPYYYGLGNHDIENNFGHCFDNSCFKSSMDNLRIHIGNRVPSNQSDINIRMGDPIVPAYFNGSFAYVVNFDRICSIQLNNYPTMEARTLAIHLHENLSWLRNQLQIAREQGRIIIIHVHQTGMLTPTYRNLFQEFGVVAIFGGHLHNNLGHYSTYNNIPVFLSGSASQRTYLILEQWTDRLDIYAVRCNDWINHRQLVRSIPVLITGRFKIRVASNSNYGLSKLNNNNVELWGGNYSDFWDVEYHPQKQAHIIKFATTQSNLVLAWKASINDRLVVATPFNSAYDEQYWILEPVNNGYIFKSKINPNLVLTVDRIIWNGQNMIVSELAPLSSSDINRQIFLLQSS
ncbi:metallophosphoesterase [Bacillus thuringiensis]|uniref:metallophosphoesterase n=1 Tax=Bacillus thuringiensis TaxID=1428 RepID=UPI003D0EA63E